MKEQVQQILNDDKFQKQLSTLTVEHDLNLVDVRKEAEEYLKELFTVQDPIMQSIGVHMAQYILNRAYDKTIDVVEEEVKALAKLMRKHPVAFVMTHKTYIDMFVLGVVLARFGLPIPFIFSGINMSFLGVGELGRKSGAIFIRRSFKDNIVYKACLKHFMGYLLDQKSHFMWAIEGTRSRTGKLVWPKMGILKYIHESSTYAKTSVKYVPVSIVYDLIPDVEDMTKEGRGQLKNQENIFWFLNYVRKMNKDYGRISIRFGEPTEMSESSDADIQIVNQHRESTEISKFAFEIVHDINQVTPVTTASLICASLLSSFALKKKEVELAVLELMSLIENRKPNALVERGVSISQTVQSSINLLSQNGIIRQLGEGIEARYSLIPENFLTATYYANMAVHHLYHRAFIELAIVRVSSDKSESKILDFWSEIMYLRDLFKFEFFYSQKATFSDEIETDLKHLNAFWQDALVKNERNPLELLKDQNIIISQVVLSTYIEAYKVVAYALKRTEKNRNYSEKQLLTLCLFVGEEMHWKGRIHRVDSVSQPFILNGIRLARNKDLIPNEKNRKIGKLDQWIKDLDELLDRIKLLQDYHVNKPKSKFKFPIKEIKVPGNRISQLTKKIFEGEKGAHIGAFFDLDQTLISEFSAKEFFTSRVKSGKMTPKELVAQFGGAFTYALGNKDFAGLAAISAKGIKGISEQNFIDLGEEVYLKHLSKSIYPESRALVEAHAAMGHTVAIISAATPYQVNPIARDLGIDHIKCTELELKNGKFTGHIVEPACWGQGKSDAAHSLVEQFDLDLKKSHFYTDSISDLPLMEIVGHPHP